MISIAQKGKSPIKTKQNKKTHTTQTSYTTAWGFKFSTTHSATQTTESRLRYKTVLFHSEVHKASNFSRIRLRENCLLG